MSRIFTRGTTTLIVCSHGIALFLEHMDDEQEPKISSEISPHINDKQLGRLNSYISSNDKSACFNVVLVFSFIITYSGASMTPAFTFN